MTDVAEVKPKTAEELEAEKVQLEAEVQKHRDAIAADNERLKLELADLKRINAKVPTCPACGSDGHAHCNQPVHMRDRKVYHGSGSERYGFSRPDAFDDRE